MLFRYAIFMACLLAALHHMNAFAQDQVVTKPERIGYVTFKPGNWDIYYHSKRGVPARRLTDDPSLDYDATLSPDGRWVVFTSERQGNPSLYVLDLQNDGIPKLLIDSSAMQDQATISPDGATMAFVSTHEGNADIYLLPFSPEKTQSLAAATNLTQNAGGDFRPAFSPDGSMLAFSSDRNCIPSGVPTARERAGQIFLVDMQGRQCRQISDQGDWSGSPFWSHDGKTLFYYVADRVAEPTGAAGRPIKETRLYAMNSDGTEPRSVGPAGQIHLSPSMSGSGRLFFSSRIGGIRDAKWEIRSILEDGSDERLESDQEFSYWSPSCHAESESWVCHGTSPPKEDAVKSPVFGNAPFLGAAAPIELQELDRNVVLYPYRGFGIAIHPQKDRIAYIARTSDTRILTATSDGSDPQPAYTWPERQSPFTALNWSKDGEWLTFMSGQNFGPPNSSAEVWKVRYDGSQETNLTPNAAGNNGFADFSGDGSRLVFRSGRNGRYDIYLMNADGSNVRNLTDHPARDTFRAFSPLNDEIVFASDRAGELDTVSGRRTFDLFTLSIDKLGTSTRLTQITSDLGQDSHAKYSPDGAWIVYSSERAGITDEEPLVQTVLFNPQMYGEIYAYRRRDGKSVRITHNKWEDGIPTWVGPVKQ